MAGAVARAVVDSSWSRSSLIEGRSSAFGVVSSEVAKDGFVALLNAAWFRGGGFRLDLRAWLSARVRYFVQSMSSKMTRLTRSTSSAVVPNPRLVHEMSTPIPSRLATIAGESSSASAATSSGERKRSGPAPPTS